MKRILFILAFLLAVLPMAARLAPTPYPYVVIAEGEDEVNISDSLFYEMASSVIFPVNKWAIPKNSKFIDELMSNVIPLMNQRGMRLEKVLMRGAASPEGPTGWNQTLGQNRLESLYKLITSRMDMPSCEECLGKIDVPEDYKYLVRMMREANDPDADYVQSLVDQYYDTDPALLKRTLQHAQHKQLWARLLHTYFPKLRAARVVLVFRKSPVVDKVAPGKVDVRADGPDMSYKPIIDDTKQVTPVVPVIPEIPVVAEDDREARREMLSVKTNLLMDFAYMPAGYDRMCSMPNVAIEYYPRHGHFTAGASFDLPWHQDYDGHRYFQARNYQVEGRYYFRSGDIRKNPPGQGMAFRGWYLQGYGHVTKYGIMFGTHRGWMGEGAGAGLGLGYVLPLSKNGRWRLEFGAQAGLFQTKYDPFQYECPVDPTEHDNLYYYKWTLDADLFKKRQYIFTWMGPTRVGVTLTYDLLYWKNQKKGKHRGVSFNRWEKK